MPVTIDNVTENLRRIATLDPEVIARIKSGELALWPGVIRYGKNHPDGLGGQVFKHIVIPNDVAHAEEELNKLKDAVSEGLRSVQTSMGSVSDGINELKSSLNSIVGLQQANLVMSGLNLAVSVAGFAIVCSKLNSIGSDIKKQTAGINELLELAKMTQERDYFWENSDLYSWIDSAQDFCADDRTSALPGLIPPLKKHYQFNLLMLQKLADQPTVNTAGVENLKLLQTRLFNIGILVSYLQFRIGSPATSQKTLNSMSTHISNLNSKRVEALTSTSNRRHATKLTHEHFGDIKKLLDIGRSAMPALAYQSELLQFEIEHPGALLNIQNFGKIVLLDAA